MHLGKKRDRNAEAASIAAFPQHTGRRSPITEGINFNSSRRSLQMNDLNVKVLSPHRSTPNNLMQRLRIAQVLH